MFVGYEPGSNAYRIFLHDTGKVVVSNNVVFNESEGGIKTVCSKVPTVSLDMDDE